MLTQEQIAALNAHALTVPEMITAIGIGDDAAIQTYYNTLTTLYGWKTAIAPEEYLEVIDWPEVENLLTGNARIWEWITSNQTRTISTAKPNVRSGLAAAFTNLQSPNTRSGLLGIASRLLTKAESLLIVSDASTGTASNAHTMIFEGNITIQEASLIRVYGT